MMPDSYSRLFTNTDEFGKMDKNNIGIAERCGASQIVDQFQ
jgi:hypothetical protein